MELNEEDKQILIEWYLYINKYSNKFFMEKDHEMYKALVGGPKEEEEEMPFFAMGNEELASKPSVGATITCKNCGEEHDISYGEKVLEDGTKVPSKLLAFYKCGDDSYLAGINGKLV